MNYEKLQKKAFQTGKIPENLDENETLQWFALQGLIALYKAGDVNQPSATKWKKTIGTMFDDGERIKNRDREREADVQELLDKIRFAVLLHANPYALFLQACRCVSILLDDGELFFRQVKTDCYEISGKALEDEDLLVCEREQLERDMRRLEQKLQEEKDARAVHILSRAVGAMRAREEELSHRTQKGAFADGA